jgi:hypothetical protein
MSDCKTCGQEVPQLQTRIDNDVHIALDPDACAYPIRIVSCVGPWDGDVDDRIDETILLTVLNARNLARWILDHTEGDES